MISKHFKIQELVPKSVFEKYGLRAWQFIDANLIISLDALKLHFPKGTITVNNWLWGGVYSQSGLRTKESEYYKPFSMHAMGKAVDCKFSDYKESEVRDFIEKNRDLFPFINGMEKDTSWLHIDTRNSSTLVYFNG